MSETPEGLLGDIKIANVFHQPVQAKNLNFHSFTIQILYYQSNIYLTHKEVFIICSR